MLRNLRSSWVLSPICSQSHSSIVKIGNNRTSKTICSTVPDHIGPDPIITTGCNNNGGKKKVDMDLNCSIPYLLSSSKGVGVSIKLSKDVPRYSAFAQKIEVFFSGSVPDLLLVPKA